MKKLFNSNTFTKFLVLWAAVMAFTYISSALVDVLYSYIPNLPEVTTRIILALVIIIVFGIGIVIIINNEKQKEKAIKRLEQEYLESKKTQREKLFREKKGF